MATEPYASLHEAADEHLEIRSEQVAPEQTGPSAEQEALREQISDELQQQLALERFQQERPELWIQVNASAAYGSARRVRKRRISTGQLLYLCQHTRLSKLCGEKGAGGRSRHLPNHHRHLRR